MTLQSYLSTYISVQNLSAREFSRQSNISPQVINNILKDPTYRPAVDTIVKISRRLKLSPSLVLQMVIPEEYPEEEYPEEAKLVAEAFTKADEHVQDLVLKLLEIKVR